MIIPRAVAGQTDAPITTTPGAATVGGCLTEEEVGIMAAAPLANRDRHLILTNNNNNLQTVVAVVRPTRT